MHICIQGENICILKCVCIYIYIHNVKMNENPMKWKLLFEKFFISVSDIDTRWNYYG